MTRRKDFLVYNSNENAIYTILLRKTIYTRLQVSEVHPKNPITWKKPTSFVPHVPQDYIIYGMFVILKREIKVLTVTVVTLYTI